MKYNNLTENDLKALYCTKRFFQFHDAHYHTYIGYKMNQITSGKSLSEIKKEQIEHQYNIKREWYRDYPQIGDHVIFRSVDGLDNIYDGYGVVEKVHAHDYRTGYALYTVKLEEGNDTYQLYCNRPGHEDKEWIKRV